MRRYSLTLLFGFVVTAALAYLLLLNPAFLAEWRAAILAFEQKMLPQNLSPMAAETELRVEYGSIAIAGVVMTLAALRLRATWLLSAFLGLAILFAAFVFLNIVQQSTIINVLYSILGAGVICVALVLWKVFVTERAGRNLRKLFAPYVSAATLDHIENKPQDAALRGEEREVTVLYADIKNSTELVKTLSPQEFTTHVRHLLGLCAEAVLADGGTVSKNLGDGFLAFWNAPLPVAEHQYRAAQAALRISKSLEAYNRRRDVAALLSKKDLQPFGLRIGLATGKAMVGNFGQGNRFDYTVLGPALNLAIQAETASKSIGCDILLASELQGKSNELATLNAGRLALKDATSRIRTFAIFGATKDDSYRQADMTLYGFQSGTRMILPPLPENYTRFIERLEPRRADYAAK